jgi:hypothetical protein
MIAALLVSALAAGAPPVLVVPDAVFGDAQVATTEPILVWPRATKLVATREGDELVARFDTPITPAAIDAFRAAAGVALGDMRWNDDSLVLRAASGWAMAWRQDGATVAVNFTPPADLVDVASDDGAHEAALALVQADLAGGYPGAARRHARALVAADPSDRQAARLLADTRAADGDLYGAAQGYRALSADDRAARRTVAAAAGQASATVVARDGGDLSQVDAAARVDVAVGHGVTVGAAARYVASRVDTGATRTAAGEPVVEAALTAALADSLRISLIAAAALEDGVTGGGARIVYGPAELQWRAGFAYRLPDFSTTQQVLAGGYLTRGFVGATWRLTPALVAQADVGINRYGLADARAGSRSITVAGGADYLIRRQFPSLGLTYRIETEYVQSMGAAPDGRVLVPLIDRENHTVQGLVSGALGEVQLTGLAGWTVDRFGGNGPNASIGLAAPIGIAWRVEASGGITSIARQGFTGRQLFARAQVSRSLGDGR